MKTFKFWLILFSLMLLTLGLSGPSKTVTLKHAGYISYYNTDLKYPVRVEWWDTKARLGCTDKLPRKDKFAADPLLPAETDLAGDYVGSGLDRGHMCPAADNQCDSQQLLECFYFSNMAPQYHSLNAGDWKKLEMRVRDLAMEYDSVKVWCGSIGEQERIGRVAVPEKCWKVIYIKRTKQWEAYLFNNGPEKPIGLDHWKTSKSEIEKLVSFKFKNLN